MRTSLSELMVEIEELLQQGKTEQEIAQQLFVPYELVEQAVALIDEINYHTDMESMP